MEFSKTSPRSNREISGLKVVVNQAFKIILAIPFASGPGALEEALYVSPNIFGFDGLP